MTPTAVLTITGTDIPRTSTAASARDSRSAAGPISEQWNGALTGSGTDAMEDIDVDKLTDEEGEEEIADLCDGGIGHEAAEVMRLERAEVADKHGERGERGEGENAPHHVTSPWSSGRRTPSCSPA